MSSHLTPTTELQAVNRILATIGESPVNSLENIEVPDAGMALEELRSASREMQQRGWWFNTERSFEIVPDGDGFIQLPANTMDVDTVDGSENLGLVQRGSRMYDPFNHTFVVDETVKVDLVVLLDFSDLPEIARQYVFQEAGRRFQDNTVGDAALHRFKQSDAERAWAALEVKEGENGDFNILTDNVSTYRVVARRRVDQGYN